MTIGGVTGPGGAGKTSLTVNLGALLTHDGVRTLLIDADLYFPDMAFHLGIKSPYTIGAYLKNPRVDLNWLIHRYRFNGLYAIIGDTEAPPDPDAPYSKIPGLLEVLRHFYGGILVDFPLGLPVAAHKVVDMLDFQILVIDPSNVPLIDIEDYVEATIRKFRETGCPNLGVIINRPSLPQDRLEDLISFIEDALEVPLYGIIPFDPAIFEETTAGIVSPTVAFEPLKEVVHIIEDRFL
ncbi:MinD/ParA family protein [Thermococcus sp.]|uniref:MinD/ParA family ATP-binding protein n=1 Tax=Thermococcus sp. TaxID=35749 RepID=UPI00261CF5AA|nr:MinD/ParA family protein [Thermococcus sp.]